MPTIINPTDPATWPTNADGSLVCAHRDLSVCPPCQAHPDRVDVLGAHFYEPDPERARALRLIVAEFDAAPLDEVDA